jgi:hypothetical protein
MVEWSRIAEDNAMTDSRPEIPWVDSNKFNENTSKIPAEELLQYAGQVIAWNLDGTRILASGKDELDVDKKLRLLGIDPSQVVFDNVPESDTIF